METLISLLLITTVHAISIPNTTERTIIEQRLSALVSALSTRYFPPGRLLIYEDLFKDAPALKPLHKECYWPILTQVRPEEYSNYKYKAHSYVIYTNERTIENQLERLSKHHTWNSRARYAIVLDSFENEAEASKAVLGAMWRKRIVNVLLITKTPPCRNFYTYFPYRESGNCAGHVVNITLLHRWCANVDAPLPNLFPKKIPSDLRRCPLTVSVFDYPPFVEDITPANSSEDISFAGIEILLLKVIAAACNLVIKYLPPPPADIRWGRLFPNGTWDGSMGNVYYGAANLTLGSLINKGYREKYFEHTHYYLTNAIGWVVPRARQIPRWKSPVRIFTPSFWAIVIATLILASGLFWMMGNVPRRNIVDPLTYRWLSNCVCNALAILLGLSVPDRPRSMSFRTFFLLWAFYCLQINTAYQSYLISVLTEPRYERQIRTVEELLESGSEIGLPKGYMDFMQESFPTATFSTCPEGFGCLDRVAFGERFAMVADEEFVSFSLPEDYVDDSGKSHVKLLSDKVFSYYVSMMFKKDNILLDRFDSLIQRVNQAGLMLKWRRDVMYKPRRRDAPGQTSGRVRLKTSHLQGAFAVLVFGGLVSLVVFVVEVVTGRTDPRGHHRTTARQ